MPKFKVKSNYSPAGDQPQAIEKLVEGFNAGIKYQTLLGVTGSGKTFTMAKVIEKLQMPTLIISHNKTLAGQLYQELRDFFPENAVSYFVSYYDYYQPEAYIPSTDTYIEKDAQINQLIDKLRLLTTTNILTRNDAIVIASVSCIYNIGSPKEYGNYIVEFKKGQHARRDQLLEKLVSLHYERGDYGFQRATFRVRGDTIDIYPAYLDIALRVELLGDHIEKVSSIDPVSGKIIEKSLDNFILYPAKHFMMDPAQNKPAFEQIKSDLKKQITLLRATGRELEAQRLNQKVKYDLEMIQEVGYVKGIENYSRYFDGRQPGDAPYSLLDYFREMYGNNWQVIVDESHMTFPQIRGMYGGDLSRKQTLIDYGFRLPSALDNRPLRFDEFMDKIPNFTAVSATPAQWELDISRQSYEHAIKNNHPVNSNQLAADAVAEQLVRPTGIPDPKVDIRPTTNQVLDITKEIQARAKKHQRTLVTTLTKRTAEDLATYLEDKGLNVHYLHSDIKTLERASILDSLRKGDYDALIGINLLREGLDLPEVALVAILDADKEGFLRSETALVQTMGRAARHLQGEVILYADKATGSIQRALKEIKRRRIHQLKWNKEHNITPTQIIKPIRQRLIEEEEQGDTWEFEKQTFGNLKTLPDIDMDALTPMDRKRLITKLKKEMNIAAQDLNFELAAEIRDKIKDLTF